MRRDAARNYWVIATLPRLALRCLVSSARLVHHLGNDLSGEDTYAGLLMEMRWS